MVQELPHKKFAISAKSGMGNYGSSKIYHQMLLSELLYDLHHTPCDVALQFIHNKNLARVNPIPQHHIFE
jgi:hypothetical protein